jgi:hypothetical protein
VLFALAAIGIAVILTACEGPTPDTDKELFPTPEALTGARALLLGKRIADFVRANQRLPQDLNELGPIPPGFDPPDSPYKDGWGRPFVLVAQGEGWEVRSFGKDGIRATADDIVDQVAHPDSVR